MRVPCRVQAPRGMSDALPVLVRPSILENGDAKNFATRMAPKQRRHFDSSAGAKLAKKAQRKRM